MIGEMESRYAQHTMMLSTVISSTLIQKRASFDVSQASIRKILVSAKSV